LRSGSIAGIRFGKVIIIGHSLGSTAVWQEAITHGDVDGVVITGAAHSLASAFINFMPPPFYPAVDDPEFANSGLDTGYLTTVPGVRSALFYSSPDYDPAIIPLDERRKDVVSATELTTGVQPVTSNATQAIQVPCIQFSAPSWSLKLPSQPRGPAHVHHYQFAA
jgi:pimeloyl-ACP methyl ester carboxylesterase